MGYAYWRKCDFQVHTPRDPNWTGPYPPGVNDPIDGTCQPATLQDVENARRQWADGFVAACIDRGLTAVAITDHHELVMVPHVQSAIARRKTDNPDFDLWLFPGMELTCHGGKQCLILFDADLPKDWQQQTQGKLGIVYADLDETKAKSQKVTQLTCSYPDIAAELDEIAGLKGRYIVLPNVSEGGSHTVLTHGHHADFRRMPYAGGYLDRDQTIHTLGTKNRSRISGTVLQWSGREIYPLPTSDSRSADYAHLGANNTWIKLATPTAEAIRQAFLGHLSRIRIGEPTPPSLVVSSLKLRGTTIVNDCSLELSPEMNTAIGGRGSGKSTLLEYLSFGLGRSCYDVSRPQYSGTERLHGLIDDTLITKGAEVTVCVVQDSATFVITRGPSAQYHPQITYPNGTKQITTAKELRDLFPATVYSQGELSDVGKQAERRTQLSDLLQFINQEYKRDDEKVASGLELAKNATRSSVQNLTTYWSLLAKQRKSTTSRDSLVERISALEKMLPMLSEGEQAKIELFSKMEAFETKRVQASKHADQIRVRLTVAETELSSARDLTTLLVREAEPIQQTYKLLIDTFVDGLRTLKSNVENRRSALADAEIGWSALHRESRLARDEVLKKLGEHKAVTSQIIKLREELSELTNSIGDLEVEVEAYGNPASKLAADVGRLKSLARERADSTRKWAEEVEILSNGRIRASVEVAGDMSDVKEAIDFVARQTGSQEATRIRQMEEFTRSGNIWDWLDKIRTNCLAILHWQGAGAAMAESEPVCADLMRLLGDTKKIRRAVLERMTTQRVEAVSAAIPNPEITLVYCDGDRQISFEKASEGQRAGALLFMLLEQAGGPLIVDQPEGDLDNKLIAELTDKLHDSKRLRQLFFASHNANIVVNGSSELVCHLDVGDDGKRQVDLSGAIDEPRICRLIADTVEGGEKAFIDRKNKYGY